ncbi:MAG: ABC transporter permease [Myxococcaceae bacterium]|nr:ABC transporter permease [Myxococcaceae bacterium]
MRLLWAFLRRDLKIAASYRLSFVFMVAGAFVTLTTFYFLARTFGQTPLLQDRYGADYFSFALMGLATASALRALQTSFAARLRQAQVDGSLEVLLSAPLSTFRVVTLLAAWPIGSALVRALGLIALGTLLFGARLHLDPLAFALVLALGLASFGALGLLSAAFVLTFKRGDPFSYFLDVATYLLSGVVYPVEVLPGWLRFAGRLLPSTWALHGLRAAGLQGAGLGELSGTLGVLVAFSAVLWPVAWWAISASRRHAERVGTLSQF